MSILMLEYVKGSSLTTACTCLTTLTTKLNLLLLWKLLKPGKGKRQNFYIHLMFCLLNFPRRHPFNNFRMTLLSPLWTLIILSLVSFVGNLQAVSHWIISIFSCWNFCKDLRTNIKMKEVWNFVSIRLTSKINQENKILEL